MRIVVFFITGLLCLCISGCSVLSSTETNQNTSATSPNLSEYTDASVALADGTKFLDTGETDSAIDALSQAVRLNPDLAEAWFKLGIAHSLAELRAQTSEVTTTNETSKSTKSNSVKAFEKAVAAYKKAIEANADDHLAHYNLGRAYYKLNEDQDAARALRQAVKLMPDDTEYQTELGAILIKLAQYPEAIPPLKKALELDPENIRAQELLEDAQAGRSRVNYSATPRDPKKQSNSNSDSNSADPDNGTEKPTPQPPPPSPAASQTRPRPTATRPGN